MSEVPVAPRVRRRGLMLVGALLATIITFVAGTEVALAHHAEGEASIDCAGVVTWTAKSWNGDTAASKTNPNVKVWYQVQGAGANVVLSPSDPADVSPVDPLNGQFNAANGFDFGNTFQYPSGASYINIYFKALANWGNGVGPNGDPYDWKVKVEPLTKCPDVTVKVKCAAINPGKVEVTISNKSSYAADYDVWFNASKVDANGVDSTHPKTVTYSTGAGQVVVKVTFDGKTTSLFTQTVDVQSCTLKLTAECSVPGAATGTVLATVANPSTFALVFTVALDGGDARTVSIAAGGTGSTTFTNVAGGSHTVTAEAGYVKLSQTITVEDCELDLTVTSVCSSASSATGKVTATVASAVPLTFKVKLDDGAESDVVVTSGSASITFDGVSAGPHTVTATPEGGAAITQQINVETCTLTLTAVCSGATTGVVTVALSTTSPTPIDFAVVLGAFSTVVTGVSSTTPQSITIPGLATGTYQVDVTPSGGATFSASVDVHGCSTTVTTQCSSVNTGTVKVVVGNEGPTPVDISVQLDDGAVTTFTGVTNATAEADRSIVYGPVALGTHTVTSTIASGSPVAYQVNVAGCGPELTGRPICNEVDVNNQPIGYFFVITNPQDVDVHITFEGGEADVPAHESLQIKANAAVVHITYLDQIVMTLNASQEVCGRTVVFEKKLVGQPPTGETYTILVSRLVGAAYQQYLQFDLQAGIPKQFTLPSTLDPEGISYKVEEVNVGTSTVHKVSPDTFELSGNLGETVSVVVTNGYASVEIDKTVNSPTAKPGEQLKYTLVAKNTGGLTLDPVVITDLMPPRMSLLSALVVGGTAAGTCTTLTSGERPIVIECAMVNALAPGASTPAIEIVGVVDATTPVGTLVLNQALVLGTYVTDFSTPVAENLAPSRNGLRGEAIVNGELSCEPIVAGTVCDVSAKVGSSVTEPDIQVEPPTTPPPTTQPPPPSVPPPTQLPVTGSSGVGSMLLIGFVLSAGGAAILFVRRRRPHRA